MKSMNLKIAIAAVLLGASALAFGAPGGVPGPGGGGGGGGGGGKPTDELSNNLSVPVIMLGGGSFTGVTCGANGAWSGLVAPTGGPLTGYEVEGSYYVQRVHVWQAPCTTGVSAEVLGFWGDNLVGDAKLKVGSPIRVEIVLEDSTGLVPVVGYQVIKLEPSMLDRESPYGTLATSGDGGVTWYATSTPFNPLVYDADATLTIQNLGTGDFVPNTNATAEINATGKVVYGYNLRVTAPGSYEIVFVMPNVTFTGVDAGEFIGNTASLVINVTGGGGGGGKKGPRTN